MNLLDRPIVFFGLCFVGLWLSTQLGAYLRRRREGQDEAEHEEVSVILGATLTLLGLIIGFSFSMATSRYDQRKNYEEAEANAIGTEYVRLGVLSSADATRARNLLKSYLDQRILFYTTRDLATRHRIDSDTAHLQKDLWSAVQTPVVAQPNQVNALVLSGMNDVLNSQGYTQAAWWNRIPITAWVLMIVIGICCNVLFGHNARHPEGQNWRFLVLPLIVAVAFFLIADLDSPTGGVIRVSPQNLVSTADFLRAW
jgi:F0F1-type ATP synthase membrane subunit c/vacuolar-type H+-ATPase subunit K